MKVLALHGFLGLPSDWQFLQSALPSVAALDLWNDVGDPSGSDPLTRWAEKFNRAVAKQAQKPLLVGYSMGGRLAMHAALLEPQNFSGAIFISAHPGLVAPEARAQRLDADRNWAQRFLSESWSQLMSEWNSQAVLQSPAQAESIVFERNESDFKRQKLAFGMDGWSLGRQGDLRSGLKDLQLPVLFVSGAADEKFTSLLKAIQLNPCQEHKVVAGAGHRLPWDRPKEFVKIVKEFQRKL